MTTTTTAPDRLLTPDETATLLGVQTTTLTTWRCTHRYPLRYVRVGRRIKYRAADVARFIDSRTVTPCEAGI